MKMVFALWGSEKMDDVIRRQDAIDEIARWIGYLDKDMISRIQIGLERLPSAQPTEPNTPNTLEALECISRKDAIDALERKKDRNAKGDIGGFYNKIIQNDIDTLMQLPSAQPEWEELLVICDNCGHAIRVKRH